ncbi:MAG: peptidoglycan recognition protein family protein [Eubacteriaceae bacterium]|nr:peptidoglycan recognition protein family protein [Eubacteriaceae bacterium]
MRHDRYRQQNRQAASRRGSPRRRRRRTAGIMLFVLVASVLIFGGMKVLTLIKVHNLASLEVPSYVTQEYLTEDGHHRTGKSLTGIKNIVIHYTANPGSTAQENRDYFNQSTTYVSSHFIVGLQGEIIQCIPLNEQSSASNRANPYSISIEVCIPDSTGEFNIPAYNSAVKLTAWLCRNLGLSADDVIRHYDCDGANHKDCPKYYVEHPQAWAQFKEYVRERI